MLMSIQLIIIIMTFEQVYTDVTILNTPLYVRVKTY